MVTINEPRYINPYTDFGFKKLFGTELNKDLLISFLNALLDGRKEIKDVQYLNGEHLGDGYDERKTVFDVYCELENGEKFIVEMQKAEQYYFKDRSLYYATTPIREQAPVGRWDYHLNEVYMVGLLNFCFPDKEYPEDSFRHEIKLMDVADKHVFYDKLTFIYLEMPKFNKTEDELVTMFDKWMFALHNLARLMERPAALQERVFTRLFEQAEIAKYAPADRREYTESLKDYWDYYSVMRTSEDRGIQIGKEEGRKEGIQIGKEEGIQIGEKRGVEQEKKETVLRLHQMGLSVEQIAGGANVPVEKVREILNCNK